MSEVLFSSDMGGRVSGTLYLKNSDNETTEYNPESGHTNTTFSVGPKCIILMYNEPDTNDFVSLYSNKVPILCKYAETGRNVYLNMVARSTSNAIFTAVVPTISSGARLYNANYNITDKTWTMTITNL